MSMNIDYLTNKVGYTSNAMEDAYSSKNQNVKNDAMKKDNADDKDGVIYDKSSGKTDNSLYSINKMSKSDRDAIVSQLKAETEKRQQQLMDLVHKTLSGQAGAYGAATGDNVWKILASGNFTVDAATKAQAQKDISEDGYWGVKKTSQRLFDFASALAGDDVEKMKKMQAAMEKGFQKATKTWGRELPSICKDTIDAANKLFEDYYASKG